MKCVVCKSSINRGDFVSCPSCGLVQKVPMPTAREIAALYHEDFDHFTPYLEQIDVHRAYFKQKIRDIVTTVHRNNVSLLDIGCAMGVLLEEAQKQGMKVTGVDISKDAVAYCRKKGLDVSTSWPKRRFDVITAFQIIEHERDPLGFMRRVHNLLKEGGLVVLATPDAGGMWRKFMGKRWVGFTHPEHVVLLNAQSMRVLLERAGFRDIEIRRDSPRPFPLSFAFIRAADYFPSLSWILKPMGIFFDQFDVKNPINPWDDMIVFARK